ncbi:MULTISPECIES: S9 family peptidase [unclassified Rhodococcus (in: high G+C Gram-positive bacteria)]|uniref:alpha/beta hydrolase family protein n=1 Tax=unclassified Rhodococcus (in: high G+C Gram-positive bacteria) TaxID=192944 RepID=UPI00163A5E9F|nr:MULTISPECIES: alpha/beta hydrolase [unclassified Rhodococcus (in: high G+C Gram-positive bacteria)]MBC2639189.1 alpha/beta hydrolase [Rhodococcus sp. 3A]MBC2896068.1 alpha/beta hydrolase [Rhodococcus sp. 4CII]
MTESARRLDVVFAPGTVAHHGTAEELVGRALDARGLAGEVMFAADTVDLQRAVRMAAGRGEFVVVPGAGAPFTAPACGAIRVDFGECEPDRSDGIRAHIRGRGLDGLRFAVDSWYHHRVHPGKIVRYGDDIDQRAELRIPGGTGPFPVAVLVHGGYWRPRWEFDLMDGLAVDLTARGYATWNVEYRRPAENRWAAMTSDVAAALQAAGSLPGADPGRVVILGHSAGGQLALRAAADSVADRAAVRPALAVSLAGVLNLRLADDRRLGEGAVANAVGSHWADDPATYERSSPLARLPLGVPQLVVCGVDDEPDLLEMSRQYHAAAAATPDDVAAIEGPSDHFAVIDPDSDLWRTVAEAIDARLRPPTASTPPTTGWTPRDPARDPRSARPSSLP